MFKYCFLPSFLTLASRNTFLFPAPTEETLLLSARLGFEVWNTHPNVSFVESCESTGEGKRVTVEASDTISTLALVQHPPTPSGDFRIVFNPRHLWRGEDHVCSGYRWMTQSPLHTSVTSIGIILFVFVITSLLITLSFTRHTCLSLLLLCLLFFTVFASLLSFLPCTIHWDLSTVTIHEAGHVLGLKHESTSSCRPKDTTPVMHPSADALLFPCVTRSDWYQLFPEEGCLRGEVCVTTRVGEAGRNGLLLSTGLSVLATLPFLVYALSKKRKRRRVDDSRVTRQVI